MESRLKEADDLINFIHNSPTAFHASLNAAELLRDNGFIHLNERDKWNLEKGRKYFISRNNSSIIAFIVGNGEPEDFGFKIVASHTDSPAVKIKPKAEFFTEKSYLKLNIETYGGMILNTWFDRPLSIAGRIILKSNDIYKPEELFIDMKRPVGIIPNLSVHMNPQVNKGVDLSRQVDMIPLISTIKDELKNNNYLFRSIAEEYKFNLKNIIDFDLYFYEYNRGTICGLNSDFISSPRIDNLQSLYSSLIAFAAAEPGASTKVLVSFDNEEVGSATPNGADSKMLYSILERIMLCMNKGKEDYYRSIQSSFMISLDCVHAVHPNRGEKSDPTNRPLINKGPALKISANKSYTTDGFTGAIFKELCDAANIPSQVYVNRSDMKGGSTIGPVSSTQLDIPCCDAGIPTLAMHSISELCGVEDNYYMVKLIKKFYE